MKKFKELLMILLSIGCIIGVVYITLICFDETADNYFNNDNNKEYYYDNWKPEQDWFRLL